MSLKIDLINGAYSQLRISGITLDPSAEDVETALDRLETLCAELGSRNVCFGYNFEDAPDPNSESNVERKYKQAIETALAVRLLNDFGKPITAELSMSSKASMSALVASTANTRQVAYPSRQPVGSGNDLRWNRYQRYYGQTDEAPNTCATVTMFKGDIDNFVEHFDADLGTGETLSSYVLTADTGLFVVSESLTSPDVDYRIRADGNSYSGNTNLRVKVVATTSLGRVITKTRAFIVVDPDA